MRSDDNGGFKPVLDDEALGALSSLALAYVGDPSLSS
jgi:hypothetical protein